MNIIILTGYNITYLLKMSSTSLDALNLTLKIFSEHHSQLLGEELIKNDQRISVIQSLIDSMNKDAVMSTIIIPEFSIKLKLARSEDLFSGLTLDKLTLALSQGADPNYVNTFSGATCLHNYNDYDCISALIIAGAKPVVNKNKDTVLLRHVNDLKIVYLFLYCFANVNVPDELLSATEKAKHPRSEQVLIDIHACDYNGDNILYRVRQYDEAVKFLLSLGVSGTTIDRNGNPILPYCHNVKSLELLLQADNKLVNYVDKYRILVWYKAKHAEELKVYLKYGADIQGVGRLCLWNFHQFDMIKLLLSSGVDVNAVDENGDNILFREEFVEVIILYLRAGADPYYTNKGVQAISFPWVSNAIKKILTTGKNE
jgi:ankyrin repeat protein